MMGTEELTKYRHIAPLAVLRMAFGAVMCCSTIRFISKGWVHDFYIAPSFHFPFFGWEWLHPLPAAGMYTLYWLMALAALGICLGWYYRIAAPLFFLCFSYAALLDKTYYLNHYYLVTLISFLLVLVPAHRYCSLDVRRKSSLQVTAVPAWTILIFKYQLCITYLFAGLSKLTKDWLIDAQPLKIWLMAKSSTPVLGPLLHQTWAAYAFSWASALFDLCIPFLLLNKRTRKAAYALVVIFHLLTAVLFQIGMFPYIMICLTPVFFSEAFHTRITQVFSGRQLTGEKRLALPSPFLIILGVYFVLQLALPLRFLLYPGKLLWTEEGYRFSWRVMLMEKSGAAYFYVKNPANGRRRQVKNRQFLSPYQERMMETQPDMILQYAHILQHYYQQHGITQAAVTVESYVSLNGAGSRLFIDSTVNLANEQESFLRHKTWILPYTNQQTP